MFRIHMSRMFNEAKEFHADDIIEYWRRNVKIYLHTMRISGEKKVKTLLSKDREDPRYSRLIELVKERLTADEYEDVQRALSESEDDEE